MRLVRAPDGRLVAILGEAHLKLARAQALGRDVVSSFELRGVESFQHRQVAWGRAFALVIRVPRTLLRVLSLGAVKGSTITDARRLPSGRTVELERAERMPVGLHVASVYLTTFFTVLFLAVLSPMAPWLYRVIAVPAVLFELHFVMLLPGLLFRRSRWSWVLHPLFGILSPRDELMATGTVRMLEEHPGPRAAVVVMGRAHVRGYERLLVEHHGFTREEADGLDGDPGWPGPGETVRPAP